MSTQRDGDGRIFPNEFGRLRIAVECFQVKFYVRYGQSV